MMKLRIATFILPLAFTCSVSFADSTPAMGTNSNMMSNTTSSTNQQTMAQQNPGLLSSILQQLQNNGYVAIKEIELDDGIYKIDAFNPAGEEMTLKANPKTGEVTNMPNNPYKITMQQAAVAIEQQGYMKIISMDYDDEYYDAEVIDEDGDDIDVKVNRRTGAVSKD